MRHGLDLAYHALVAARGHHTALVEGQRAEVAASEAAAVVYDGKAHPLYRRDAAHLIVHRVHLAGIGQLGHAVKLFRLERHGGRVHHQPALAVLLRKGFAPHGVVLCVLYARRFRIRPLVGADLLIAGQDNRPIRRA